MDPVNVIFIERTNGMKVNSKFQGYYEYRYGVNPKKLLKDALSDGLLKISDVDFNVSRLKVTELKGILKANGLNVTGKKAELVERVLQNVPRSKLKRLISDSYYQLTESGQALVNDNQHLVFYHKNEMLFSEIKLATYHKEVMSGQDETYYHTALRLLDPIIKYHRQNEDWGLYRNDLSNEALLYDLLEEHENHNNNIMDVFLIDISGLGNNGRYQPQIIFLAGGYVLDFKAQIDDSKMSEASVIQLLEERYHALSLPKFCMSLEKVKDIFLFSLKDVDKGDELVKKIANDFKKHSYLEFEGESPNGNKSVNIRSTSESELSHKSRQKKSFLARLFGR